MSGINAILFFAPRMFEWAGLGHSAALLSSVGVGITNLVMTLLGIRLIDTNGRRTLLFFGGIGHALVGLNREIKPLTSPNFRATILQL